MADFSRVLQRPAPIAAGLFLHYLIMPLAAWLIAKALNMQIVVEGVETQAQAEFCTQQGCDLLQGYFYSKPIPAQEFEAAFLARPPHG